MKPMASEHETLEEHLTTCLHFLDRHFLAAGYGRHLANVFNVSEEEVTKALKLTVLFHDFGKAAEQYQSKVEKLSFPKHEYFSAYAAYKSLRQTSWKDEAVLAILWHHMAMRGPNFLADIQTWKRFNAPSKATFDQAFVDAFWGLIQDTKVSEYVAMLPPATIELREVEEMVLELHGNVSRLGVWSGLYHRSVKFLRPLLIVDVLAAAAKRGGHERVYVKDLPDPDKVNMAKEKLLLLMGR